MNESGKNSSCTPLMEACTLTLYQKNIFRVTGLPVDATSKEVSRQAQKLQMLEEYSGGTAGPQAAFPLAVPPTTDEIRAALSRMKEPEHRIIDEFFWYWPEEFGASKSDPGIQAVLAGDSEGAVQFWRDREKSGSRVAQHNMAIMYHMYAVDWTNYQLSASVDKEAEETIRGYWRRSFERWEKLVHDDRFWNILKERIRSLNDEALTTGFVRRMSKDLPEALDRINAEAALMLAEQGHIESARFHVNFMRETHQGFDNVDGTSEMVLEPTKKRVEQHLRSSLTQAKKDPKRGSELAASVMANCRPLMSIFDLFHGKEAHQRSELFDEVAEGVLTLLVGHQRATGDNETFVNLMEQALCFATGIRVRERIIENISIAKGNLEGEMVAPLFKILHSISESGKTAKEKLTMIQNVVLGSLASIESKLGRGSDTYRELADSVALAVRGISIEAHNDSSDFQTANAAIRLALVLCRSSEIKERIESDIIALRESEESHKCVVCNTRAPDPNCTLEIPIGQLPLEVQMKLLLDQKKERTVKFPQCRQCAEKRTRKSKPNSSGCLVLIMLPIICGIALSLFIIINAV
jgi:hypothetical protein